MPRYYNSVVRSHQAVRTAGCPLLRAEGETHRPCTRPTKTASVRIVSRTPKRRNAQPLHRDSASSFNSSCLP
jgi:hypothetical protein